MAGSSLKGFQPSSYWPGLGTPWGPRSFRGSDLEWDESRQQMWGNASDQRAQKIRSAASRFAS